jgi:hypothetical protein
VRLGLVVLHGRLVTFDRVVSRPTGNPEHRVKTLDLRSGKTTRRASSRGDIVDIYVAPDGSIVLWSTPGLGDHSRIDLGGPDGRRELEAGPGIDRDSIAVGDNIVYWVTSGELRSAPIDLE